jgi:hypothetical protein
MSKHRLATRGSQFTINDNSAFLLGCSYYGGLGAEEKAWRADLDDMQKAGINWIRVWATWAAFDRDVSAVDTTTGEPREPYMARLKTLIDECDRRGMVVDVTLSRGNGPTGPSRLQGLASHRRAVENLIQTLKPWSNWYLDLSNERNIQDKRFTSFDDLKQLAARVRELDPQRLLTASHGGDVTADDIRKYVVDVGLNLITPHRPRDRKSPAQTEAVTLKSFADMKTLGRIVPIHYQEPMRRGYSEPVAAADFETDLRGALAGGAAGWCFHNGATRGVDGSHPRRSFDLSKERLFDQLDAVERQAIQGFKELVFEAQRKK